MFYITATQHRNKECDILIKVDNILSIKDDFITHIIYEVETFNDALCKLGKIAEDKLDAKYHSGKDMYIINEELVFSSTDTSFIYEGVKYEIVEIDDMAHITYEWCSECDYENELVDYFAPQFCNECGTILLPCSLCEECANCPLRELKAYMQETKTEIVFVGDNLRVNGTYLMCLDNIFNNVDDEDKLVKQLVGRKVFWLDPCFLDKRYHTSAWHTIADIDLDNEIITFVGDTEVYFHECYV